MFSFYFTCLSTKISQHVFASITILRLPKMILDAQNHSAHLRIVIFHGLVQELLVVLIFFVLVIL